MMRPTTSPPRRRNAGPPRNRGPRCDGSSPSIPRPVRSPPPEPWTHKPLFKYENWPTPPGLADYCLFRYPLKSDPALSEVKELKSFVLTEYGVDVYEDKVLTGPLGFEQDIRASMRDAVFTHAGAMTKGLPLGKTRIDRIRIAFPDSSPEQKSGAILDGRMPHGSILAWLARGIANPEPELLWNPFPYKPVKSPHAAHITTGIALPQVDNDIEDILDGGYFGTRGQLAASIYRVAAAWMHDGVPQPRLVVNLSVGWEPIGNDLKRDPADLDVLSRAVYDAITHVNCLGGLVIAAAGNQTGGKEPGTGQVCPAAWSTIHHAPHATVCKPFMQPSYKNDLPSGLPIHPDFPPSNVENSLVYAVGGMDFTHFPMQASRKGSFSKYFAISTNATAGPEGDDLPAPLTGTSVAAAVVSAVAGATWAYRPELTAPELMDLLYRSGAPLDFNADLAVFGPEQARAIMLCPALQAACKPNNGIVPARCPTTPIACKAPKPEPAANPPLTTSQSLDLETLFSTAPSSAIPEGEEDIKGFLDLGAPSDQWVNAATPPWVFPQPLYPPCGACDIRINPLNPAELDLYVRIDDRYVTNNIKLSNGTLILRRGTSYWSSYPQTIDVSRTGVGVLPIARVKLGGVPGDNILSAQIVWRADDNGSIASVTDTVLVH